jgi:hypothetical protein
MLNLINKKIEVDFIKHSDFLSLIGNQNWKIANELEHEFGEEIYISNNGQILVNCIYDNQGLLFESLNAFTYFQENCSFVYIPSVDTVFYIENLSPEKYAQIMKSYDLKLIKSLTEKIGTEIYTDDSKKIYSIDSHFKTGLVYSNLSEFLLIRKEYGFDDSELIIAIGGMVGN